MYKQAGRSSIQIGDERLLYFRAYWKNGKQVNHLKLCFPPAKPFVDSLMADFIAQRDAILPTLEKVRPISPPNVEKEEETKEVENP